MKENIKLLIKFMVFLFLVNMVLDLIAMIGPSGVKAVSLFRRPITTAKTIVGTTAAASTAPAAQG